MVNAILRNVEQYDECSGRLVQELVRQGAVAPSDQKVQQDGRFTGGLPGFDLAIDFAPVEHAGERIGDFRILYAAIGGGQLLVHPGYQGFGDVAHALDATDQACGLEGDDFLQMLRIGRIRRSLHLLRELPQTAAGKIPGARPGTRRCLPTRRSRRSTARDGRRYIPTLWRSIRPELPAWPRSFLRAPEATNRTPGERVDGPTGDGTAADGRTRNRQAVGDMAETAER